MYCKDCKYWKRHSKDNSNYDESNDKRGKCSSPKFIDVSYENYFESEQKTNKSDTLEYWDFEAYKAGFNTGENFGCIHFKAGDK